MTLSVHGGWSALRFGTRVSDSPWVQAVWTCTSDGVTEMTSVAAVCWGPHLAHAPRRYVGRTAGQLREGTGGALALDLGQPATS